MNTESRGNQGEQIAYVVSVRQAEFEQINMLIMYFLSLEILFRKCLTSNY